MAVAISAVILAGRYLLNPIFRILASTGAREIMTAAALLLVISAAGLMTYAGLSSALGAFLAGIMLAESSYRHELEADIDPFRGLLLGLFFMSVGMTVDLRVRGARLAALAGRRPHAHDDQGRRRLWARACVVGAITPRRCGRPCTCRKAANSDSSSSPLPFPRA